MSKGDLYQQRMTSWWDRIPGMTSQITKSSKLWGCIWKGMHDYYWATWGFKALHSYYLSIIFLLFIINVIRDCIFNCSCSMAWPLCCWLLILPIQNYAKTWKNYWNPCKWVLIWEYSAWAFQWILTWQGLDDIRKYLRLCALYESSLSIGRVNVVFAVLCSKRNYMSTIYMPNSHLTCPGQKGRPLCWAIGHNGLTCSCWMVPPEIVVWICDILTIT